MLVSAGDVSNTATLQDRQVRIPSNFLMSGFRQEHNERDMLLNRGE
jgi:hypothetical protein